MTEFATHYFDESAELFNPGASEEQLEVVMALLDRGANPKGKNEYRYDALALLSKLLHESYGGEA